MCGFRYFDVAMAAKAKKTAREDLVGHLVVYEYLGWASTHGHESGQDDAAANFDTLFKPMTLNLNKGRLLLENLSTDLCDLHFPGQDLTLVTLHRPWGSKATDADTNKGSMLSSYWQDIFAPKKQFVVPTAGIVHNTAHKNQSILHFNRIMMGGMELTKNKYTLKHADIRRCDKALTESQRAQERANDIHNLPDH